MVLRIRVVGNTFVLDFARDRERLEALARMTLPGWFPSKKVRAIIALGSLLALPAGILAYYHATFGLQPLPLGERIPPLIISTLQGSSVSLEDYHGKKRLLVFFNVECEHCRNEISNLSALYSKYNSRIDFFVISLSSAGETERYAKDGRLPFPIFCQDPEMAKDVFKIVVVPALLLVDETQILRQQHFGEQSRGDNDRSLQSFLINCSGK